MLSSVLGSTTCDSFGRSHSLCLLQEKAVPKSKYEEDVFINNHTTVWGSWWHDNKWGYKCCKQTLRNSYCTGLAGIEAAEASNELMRANMARKEAVTGRLMEILIDHLP
jgi:pre-mRNA-processing factor SLU7